jgi:hypothetical protein
VGASKQTNTAFVAILVRALRENDDPARTPDDVMSEAIDANEARRAAWARFRKPRRTGILQRAVRKWRRE